MTHKLSGWRRLVLPIAALAVLADSGSALAQQSGRAQAAGGRSAGPVSVGLRDSVPIGSNGLCEAQIQSPRQGDGLFDRAYRIVCRDAASSVGSLRVIGSGTLDAAVAEATGDGTCRPGEVAAGLGGEPAGMADTRTFLCTSADSAIERLVVVGRSGNRLLAANGLAVYRDALRLGLGTLATDRQLEGAVEVPLTQAGDPQAFARAQAEAISADLALEEAYRRSNAGNFAEAAEFFAVSSGALRGEGAIEAGLNEALQQSNLGNFTRAAELFGENVPRAQADPVLARLARNFQALDALNRDLPGPALEQMAVPLPEVSDSLDASLQLQIDNALAERLSVEQASAVIGAASGLTLLERISLLDAQGTYIASAAQRRLGRIAEAEAGLQSAYSQIVAVRDGRVISMLWLRAQILSELAEISEARGNVAGAEAYHRESVAMLERTYPASPALISARSLLAGLLARTGREDESMLIYRQLVTETEGRPPITLRRMLAPYFRMLGARGEDPAAVTDLFAASQLLQRPGLAQTQAVLARELSGGSDEAAQLFRQATNLTRAIEVLRGEVAQAAAAVSDQVAGADLRLAEKSAQLDLLRQRQLEVQQALAAYPRYRAVSNDKIDLAGLQAALRSDEAYLKLVMLDEDAYALFVRAGQARAWRLAASPGEIDRMVDTVRDSIAIEEAGQTITYPFEIGVARELTKVLFGPVSDQLGGIEHLVFEPDGAMLRLPANLLVLDDASVAAYQTRTADPAADPYDYRGTAWLGRAMEVTTAVSPVSFRDVRRARLSAALGEYLGLGENLPLVPGSGGATGTRGGGQTGERCQWSASTWGNPISDAELRTIGSILSSDGTGVTLLTRGEFTDTGLLGRGDLNQYRIVHFATHGLVAAPEPGCPPRPALLTSFGQGDSDGLLSFGEIFDLRLDADLVILSACNTASAGGLVATREAGIATTGDFALDGLVRAFVGAGGRTIVASHWPVPDDFNATERLISGFFQADTGVATAEALRRAQVALMDDPETSHPFYWSAFAVVGDGSMALKR